MGNDLKGFIDGFKAGWGMMATAQEAKRRKDKDAADLANDKLKADNDAALLGAKLEYYGAGTAGRNLSNKAEQMKIDGTYPAQPGTIRSGTSSSYPGELPEDDPALGGIPSTLPTGQFFARGGAVQTMQDRHRSGMAPGYAGVWGGGGPYGRTYNYSPPQAQPQPQFQRTRGRARGYAEGGAVEEDPDAQYFDEAQHPRWVSKTPRPFSTEGAVSGREPGGEVQKNRPSAGVPGMVQMDMSQMPASAAPKPSAIPLSEGAATPNPMPEGTGRAPAGFSWTSGYDAGMVGIETAMKKSGLLDDMGVKPDQARGVQSYVSGANAANGKLRKEAESLIDPEGRMSPSTRNFAVLANAFDFYNKRGQTDKAANVAMELTQSMKQEADGLFTVAQAAAEEGDIDGATKAWVRAYAAVPDGLDITVHPQPDGRLGIRRIDEQSGMIVDEMLLTPQERLQIITNRGIGNFDAIMMSAANAREEIKQKAMLAGRSGAVDEGAGGTESAGMAGALPADSPVTSGVTGPKKQSDTKLAVAAVDDAWKALYGNENGEEVKSGFNKPDEAKLKGIARRLTEDQRMDAGEAVNAVQSILYIDPENPAGGVGFSAKPDYKETGIVNIDGRDVQFPPEQLKQLFAMRDKYVAKAEKDGPPQPGFLARAASRELKPGVKDTLKTFGKNVAEGPVGKAAGYAQRGAEHVIDASLGNGPFARGENYIQNELPKKIGKAIKPHAKNAVNAVQDFWSQWTKGE